MERPFDDVIEVIQDLLLMPEYDGTIETSRQRKEIKNRTRHILKKLRDMNEVNQNHLHDDAEDYFSPSYDNWNDFFLDSEEKDNMDTY